MTKARPTCKYGHVLDGENLRLKDRVATTYAHSSKGTYIERECAECHREHNRTWWNNRGRELRKLRMLGRSKCSQTNTMLLSKLVQTTPTESEEKYEKDNPNSRQGAESL